MNSYKYFIYRIASEPTASGEYIGPFATAAERDSEAARLRATRLTNLRRGVSVYRADIVDAVAATLETRPAEAA